MAVVETLAPLVILIALGVCLARVGFIGAAFLADLNRFTFWVALPALLFREAAHANGTSGSTWRLVAVLIAATLLAGLTAWMLSLLIRVPRGAQGTLVQSAFRGNLAYIGLPVVMYSLGDLTPGARTGAVATAVVAMTLTMVVYNVLAVVVLEASRPHERSGASAIRGILTNPLLLSGLGGLGASFLLHGLPAVLDRTLDTLGASAVPIALVCIGGSLTTARFYGRGRWIAAAAVLKVAAVPAITLLILPLAGLAPLERHVAMVFAATPTAAAAYVMAKELDGDEILASGSIAASTLLSFVSLAVVLACQR
jgi:predicted permease